jgi:hypothetical protein
MRLTMPKEVFAPLTRGLSLFGFISLIGYIYLISREWRTMTSDERIRKVFYIGLMISVSQ